MYMTAFTAYPIPKFIFSSTIHTFSDQLFSNNPWIRLSILLLDPHLSNEEHLKSDATFYYNFLFTPTASPPTPPPRPD